MSELVIILKGKKKKKPSALPYLSGRRMDKCRRKVHWAALIRDNHIPYFQVMPHLIADVSRYWLSVFWKPVTEPCREFSKCGGSSKCTDNWRTVGWTWLCVSHIPMNASCVLGVSVILRAQYISRLWCLSYHKTALPLCFNHTRLPDILQIYHHLFLKLFCLCACFPRPGKLLTIP